MHGGVIFWTEPDRLRRTLGAASLTCHHSLDIPGLQPTAWLRTLFREKLGEITAEAEAGEVPELVSCDRRHLTRKVLNQ